jgi:SWI/SNF-related matrix-associated actin-dependent regulator of chromatin subfamily A3
VSPYSRSFQTPYNQATLPSMTNVRVEPADDIQIFRVAVRLCGNMIELNNQLNRIAPSPLHGHAQMVIVKPKAQFLVAFLDGAVVGEVNAQLDKALTSIKEQCFELDLEVFASTNAIQETINRAGTVKEAVIRVQVDVYGPRAAAKEIGRELSQQKLYLQRPAYIRDGSRYENPHMLTLPGFENSAGDTSTSLEENAPERPSQRTLNRTMQDVYSSLTRDHNLRGLEGDERLNTALLMYVTTLPQNKQITSYEWVGFHSIVLSNIGIRRQHLTL